jgi:hypothetical protein
MTSGGFGQSGGMSQPVSGRIFVIADEPLLIFDSIERAIGWLEWQDVEDGIYAGYDQDGRRIEFTTTASHDVGYRVHEGEPNSNEFEATLRGILDQWFPSEVAASASLEDLEALAIEHFGPTA